MPNMVSLENAVTIDQSHEVIAKLGTNCDWSAIPRRVVQKAIKDPKRLGAEFTRFLQNGGKMLVVTTDGIVLPPGARMHIVAVLVDESSPWDESVNGGGPNTGADWDIRKVGDQYPLQVDAKPNMKVIYLINFGMNTMGDDNIVWAKEQKLLPVPPRAVFAIVEKNPNLDTVLGMKGCMSVVSLKECSFKGYRRAPFVWWDGTKREARLGRFDYVWYDRYWFAFSRESELGTSDPVDLRQQAEAK